MSRYVGHSVHLMDTEQRQLGQMRIARQEEDLLSGTFVPGPAFPRVEQLFYEFEAAVEVQALSLIETLDAAIAVLGLYLQWPDAREPIAVQDVQIWSDGSITCRFCEQSVVSAEAAPQTEALRQTAEGTNRIYQSHQPEMSCRFCGGDCQQGMGGAICHACAH